MEATAYEKRIKLPELLAPAGSFDALEAAIEAGADAVYFGAGDFNARMRAKNFTDDEIGRALDLCGKYGVHSYITLNTRLRDGELADALNLARKLYESGVDAFITADAGLCRLIKEKIPGARLHASTQLSGHSAKDAESFSEMGFSRMVCPREMGRDEIKALVENAPIEIEMFVHGAHCVSFSGQCMMSFVMGGRSANRGRCAQPCRLPFDMPLAKNGYPLSLKDMCLAGNITDIIDLGVSSLKIEGRQKSADYVYGVTRIYRRLLDEKRNATESEIKELSRLFSRDGFTKGYFENRYGSMLGVRGDTATESGKNFTGLTRKIPLSATLTLKTGSPAALSVTDGKRKAEVFSESPVTKSENERLAMTEDAARKNMSRLGGTPFVLENFTFDADTDAFITLSAVNALRRAAVDSLVEKRRPSSPEILKNGGYRKENTKKRKSTEKLFTAEFSTASQIPKSAYDFFDRIYVPISEFEKITDDTHSKKLFPLLPPLTYDSEEKELSEKLKAICGKEVLVHGFGQALLARKSGCVPHGSMRFNVLNSAASEVIGEYVESVCISPEVPTGLLRDIGVPSSVIVYGKIPLMLTERCMLSDGGKGCPFGGVGGRKERAAQKRESEKFGVTCDGRLCFGKMKDRTGSAFPVIGQPDCTNVIFNSVPIYMADRKDFLASLHADRLHFMFTDETPRECEGIITAYREGLAPEDEKKIRRLK